MKVLAIFKWQYKWLPCYILQGVHYCLLFTRHWPQALRFCSNQFKKRILLLKISNWPHFEFCSDSKYHLVPHDCRLMKLVDPHIQQEKEETRQGKPYCSRPKILNLDWAGCQLWNMVCQPNSKQILSCAKRRCLSQVTFRQCKNAVINKVLNFTLCMNNSLHSVLYVASLFCTLRSPRRRVCKDFWYAALSNSSKYFKFALGWMLLKLYESLTIPKRVPKPCNRDHRENRNFTLLLCNNHDAESRAIDIITGANSLDSEEGPDAIHSATSTQIY